MPFGYQFGSGFDTHAGSEVISDPWNTTGIDAICCAFIWMQRFATHTRSANAALPGNHWPAVNPFSAHQFGMIVFHRLIWVPSSGSTRFRTSSRLPASLRWIISFTPAPPPVL